MSQNHVIVNIENPIINIGQYVVTRVQWTMNVQLDCRWPIRPEYVGK
jgi:hypothetical protein